MRHALTALVASLVTSCATVTPTPSQKKVVEFRDRGSVVAEELRERHDHLVENPPEVDEVQRDECLLGLIEPCLAIAQNLDPDARVARRKKEHYQREAHRIGSAPIQPTPFSDMEPALLREDAELIKPERDRLDALNRSFAKPWYQHAVAAHLRLCRRDRTQRALAYRVDLPRSCDTSKLSPDFVGELTDEERTSIDAQVEKHRASMRLRCEGGDADACWVWSRTFAVDEDPTWRRHYALTFQALYAGSPQAMEELMPGVGPGPRVSEKKLEKELNRLKRKAKKRRPARRKTTPKEAAALKSLEVSFSDGSTDVMALAGLRRDPEFALMDEAREALCEKGDLFACYEAVSRDIRREDPKGESSSDEQKERLRAIHDKLVSRCEAKRDARSCWAAGHIAQEDLGDPDMARQHHGRGCEGGAERSCHDLGHLELAEAREDGARASFERACALGSRQSCASAGLLLAVDQEAPRHLERARALFEQSCPEGLDAEYPAMMACHMREVLSD